MALNVNIIGKDSEGNLRALKVNSEGNLEISDSLGWGELLQGISDELELVKAELQTIKANQLSGDQKVTLKDASGAVVSPATEAKLEQVRALLSGVATENKLEQARTLLDAISTKDFATQTTLAAVLAKLADLESELATIKTNQISGDQKVQLSGTPFATLKDANGNVVSPATEDKLEQVRQLLTGVATEAKLEQARVLLNAISNKDFATQATLEVVQSELALIKSELDNIKQNQTSGDQKVQLSGTKVVESAPVTGIKTVTSTVAEVFAGSSRKANRSKLVIRNLHQAIPIRIGGINITDTIGQSLEPGASVEIDFSPSTVVPIYAVSTAGNVSVEVLEV